MVNSGDSVTSLPWKPVVVAGVALILTWLTPILGNDIVLLTFGLWLLAIGAHRWRNGDSRLLIPATIGLIVFNATMFVSWQVVSLHDMEPPFHTLRRHLYSSRLRFAINDYYQEKGTYPLSLNDLGIGGDEAELLEDSWSHTLRYERIQDGYRLESLGRDGRIRGAGFDADVDLLNDNSREIAIPINQFLFESYDGHTIRSVAVLAGIFAGCAWLLCPIDARREPSPIDRRINQVVAFALIVVSTITVAVFLAALHLGAAKSGH